MENNNNNNNNSITYKYEIESQTILVNPFNNTFWLQVNKIVETLFGYASTYVQCDYDNISQKFVQINVDEHLPVNIILVKESRNNLIINGISTKGHYVNENPFTEVNIINSIPQHQNIGSILFSIIDSELFYIASPFYNGGDLFDLILNNNISEINSLILFRGIVHAVKHLHDNNIVHLDISPENIMINYELNGLMVPKLIDFGIAQQINKDNDIIQLNRSIGKDIYMSPEMFDINIQTKIYQTESISIRTKPCDIWTLGTTLMFILYKLRVCHKYPSIDKDAIFKEIFDNGDNKIENFIRNCKHNPSTSVIKLLNRMLQINPNDRITINELITVVDETITIINNS